MASLSGMRGSTANPKKGDYRSRVRKLGQNPVFSGGGDAEGNIKRLS